MPVVGVGGWLLLLCGKDGGDDAYQGDDDAAADAQSDIQKAVELCLYSVEALHHGFLICLESAEDAPDIWLVREFDLWLSGRLCRQLVRSVWVWVGVRGLVRWLVCQSCEHCPEACRHSAENDDSRAEDGEEDAIDFGFEAV